MTPSYHSQALMKSLFALGEKACQLFRKACFSARFVLFRKVITKIRRVAG
jgi:hypothetical protein